MRSWINLFEMKLTDGVMTAVTFRDLKRLVAENDMRGVAADDEVFLTPAYDDTHFGMRGRIGVAPYSAGYADDPADENGFNFYATNSSVYWEHEDGNEDETLNGREDWIAGGAPAFDIEGVAVWIDCDPKVAAANAQFARMLNLTHEPAPVQS